MHNGSERMEHVWDPVPGEPPVCPMPDFELGVPASYFEYETDNKMHYLMTFDQQFIPESERTFPAEKNPYCNREHWKPQNDLEEEELMNDPNWLPDTNQNVYNDDQFKRAKNEFLDQNRI